MYMQNSSKITAFFSYMQVFEHYFLLKRIIFVHIGHEMLFLGELITTR